MAWRLGAGLLAMVAGLTPAGAQVAAGFYLPMDRGGGGPVVWYGPGCREPLPFQRESTARAEDGGLLSDHQPRYVPGKLGEAIVYEGGDYWMHHRGTTNWLPAALALVDDSGLWEAVGAAQLEPTTAGLVGDGALRATLRTGGVAAARVRSTPFTLAHPAEFHLASVYVRGAQAKGVRLAVLDPGLRFAAQSEPLDPGADWRRLFVRFQLPKDARPKDLRLVLTAAEGAVVEFDGAMVEQAATHYHDRRSPSSWIPGMVSRALEKSTLEVWPETLDPVRGTLALWVRPLDQVTNSTLLAIGTGWTTPWRLSRDTRGEGLAEVGAAKLRLGPLPAEAWTHLAVVWEADLCRAYRNGRQVAETKCPAADLPTVEAMTAGAFRVGVGHDDLGQFARSIGANAALDEVWLSGEAWPAERVLLAATQPELLPRPALPAL
ncbi:MAG: LamG domain-containing protein, partial [Armatimonadetes bacterium]|nr:LamG domain-containing protein [Armatimonadota bacterium]